MLQDAYGQHCRDLAKTSHLAIAKVEDKMKVDLEKMGRTLDEEKEKSLKLKEEVATLKCSLGVSEKARMKAEEALIGLRFELGLFWNHA